MLESRNPDFVYVQGKAVVPAKALMSKTDPETGKVLERVRPKTHVFENDLKKYLKEILKNESIFPASGEVAIEIQHGLHSMREYNTCDLDNRAKTVLDALKDVIYSDDHQVSYLTTSKVFLLNKQESYFKIVVKILTDSLKQDLLNI